MQLLLSHPTAYAAQQQTNNNNLFITHGVASGDITEHSAVIWSRTNKQAQMHVNMTLILIFHNQSRRKLHWLIKQQTLLRMQSLRV